MNTRIEKHADILVNHSTNIEKGDFVIISAAPNSAEIVQEIYKLLGEKGAIPHLHMKLPEATSSYYENIKKEDIIESKHSKALWEKADASISIRGVSNVKSRRDISPEVISKSSKINKHVREAKLNTK